MSTHLAVHEPRAFRLVTHASACAVAERLRSTIEGTAFDVGAEPPVGVTISVGVSEFGRDGDTLDGFLNVADQRLYRAKFEGRNRVFVA
ncbi:diguanylate cyclase [Bradyrhizobium sp. BRP22]|uniref:diguanylate cyclase n=1 Tax=Bradyrhizobium sp. BRP22 TaxID=2793821 RepID=UPI001CD19F68|nr:diguanylate cyclase [Bradyrhizobium sp. BRP22]